MTNEKGIPTNNIPQLPGIFDLQTNEDSTLTTIGNTTNDNEFPKKDAATRESDENIKVSAYASEITAILTFSTSLVNMWRLPFMVGNNASDGGALVFFIAYAGALFLWTFPILIIENTLGRKFRLDVVNTITNFAGRNTWFIGLYMAFIPIITCSYLSMITTWVIYYMVSSYGYDIPNKIDDNLMFFDEMRIEKRWLLFTNVFAISIVISYFMNKGLWVLTMLNTFVVCPSLIIIQLAIFTITMNQPDISFGVSIFTPNYKRLMDVGLWYQACSQASLATCSGYGLYITYGRYFDASHFNVIRRSLSGVVIIFIFSFFCGPSCFMLVVNRYSTKFDDHEAMNVTHNSIVKALKHYNIGYFFIGTHAILGPMNKLGRGIAIIFFSGMLLVSLGILCSLIEVTVRFIQETGLSRFNGIWLTMLPINMITVYAIFSTREEILYLDDMCQVNVLYSQLFLIGLIISYGITKFRVELVNIQSDDIELPIIYNYFIVCTFSLASCVLVWYIFKIPIEYFSGEFNRHSYLIVPMLLLPIMILINRAAIYLNGDCHFFTINAFVDDDQIDIKDNTSNSKYNDVFDMEGPSECNTQLENAISIIPIDDIEIQKENDVTIKGSKAHKKSKKSKKSKSKKHKNKKQDDNLFDNFLYSMCNGTVSNINQSEYHIKGILEKDDSAHPDKNIEGGILEFTEYIPTLGDIFDETKL